MVTPIGCCNNGIDCVNIVKLETYKHILKVNTLTAAPLAPSFLSVDFVSPLVPNPFEAKVFSRAPKHAPSQAANTLNDFFILQIY